MGFLLEMPRRQELLVCQSKLAYHDYNAKMVASLFLSIQNWLMVEKNYPFIVGLISGGKFGGPYRFT